MTPEPANGRHLLLPHPVSERGAVQGLVQDLHVDVTRRSDDHLALVYRLTGDLAALRLPNFRPDFRPESRPEPRPATRTDGLWRHTCFEAFIGHEGASEYWEFNFSPSGAWAAYHFSAYREGMAPLMKGVPPVIRVHEGDDTVVVDVRLDLTWLWRSTAARGLRLGLSAVIEDRARVLSYWALKHPGEKPDFHHAAGFAIDLD